METLGQRPRRIITRISVAASTIVLAALVISAPLRHHAWHGALPTAAAATISILAGLLYLRTRGGAR